MNSRMPRKPEPPIMDLPDEVAAYAHADFAQVNEAFIARLMELAGELCHSARCIDLGTGPADIPIRLVRACPTWHVTAVDASPPMLGFARHAINQAGLAHAIEPMLADAKNTGLAARTFDVIISNSILHHIDDTTRFWQEVRRLVRRGGLVFVRDLFRPDSVDAAGEIVHRYAAQESDLLKAEYHRSLLAAYTLEEVAAQLAAAGIRELQVTVSSDRHMDISGRLCE